MAWLINVNGVYPDKDFDVKLSGSMIGMADNQHSHRMSSIASIEDQLDSKAPVNHTHDALRRVIVSGQTLSGEVELKTNDSMTITRSGQTLTLQSTRSNESSDAKGIKNANLSADDLGVFISTSNLGSILENFAALVITDNGDRNDTIS